LTVARAAPVVEYGGAAFGRCAAILRSCERSAPRGRVSSRGLSEGAGAECGNRQCQHEKGPHARLSRRCFGQMSERPAETIPFGWIASLRVCGSRGGGAWL